MAGACRLSHQGCGWVRIAGVPEANTTALPVGSSRSSAGVRIAFSWTVRVMVRRPLEMEADRTIRSVADQV
jgi:hypothetical protein